MQISMAAKYARITSKSRMLHVTYRLHVGQRSPPKPTQYFIFFAPAKSYVGLNNAPKIPRKLPRTRPKPSDGPPRSAQNGLQEPLETHENRPKIGKEKRQKEPMFPALSSNLSSLCVVIDPQGKSILNSDSYGFLH